MNIKDERKFLERYYAIMGARGGDGFRKYSAKKSGGGGVGGKRRKKSWLIDMLSRGDNVKVLEDE